MVDFHKALQNVMASPERIKQFTTDLLNHDWCHIYSDDHRAYAKGATEHKRLRELAIAGGPAYKKIFNSVFAQLNPDAMLIPFPGLSTDGEAGIPKQQNATTTTSLIMDPKILQMTVGQFIAGLFAFLAGGAPATTATPATGKGAKATPKAEPVVEAEVEDDGLGLDDEPAEEEEVVTLETIRALCGQLTKLNKKPQIKALMAKLKIETITAVPEAKQKAFSDGLKKLLA